jgi:hypothetical protein
MKKVSGNTLLLAIEADVYENATRASKRLVSIVPSYMKEWFRDNVEIHTNGTRVIILLTNHRQSSKILCGLIATYLLDVCIDEGCSAFDERFLVKVFEELMPKSEDKGSVALLKRKIEIHHKIAETLFNGNLNFHRQGNVDFVNNCYHDN